MPLKVLETFQISNFIRILRFGSILEVGLKKVLNQIIKKIILNNQKCLKPATAPQHYPVPFYCSHRECSEEEEHQEHGGEHRSIL